MNSIDINSLYAEFNKKEVKNLTGNEANKLKDGLDSIKEIKSKTEAKKFLELLALLRENDVLSIGRLGDSALATITGAFSGGDEGVYAADTDQMNARFIFELVQNVDDCKYFDASNCILKISFDLSRDIISLEYNETGFKPENVIAITGLGNSTKNHKKARNLKAEKELDQSDLLEIGEKGIGFKSIFGLAKNVKISSQYFCFSIKRDNFFVPVVEDYSRFKYTDSTLLELSLDTGMVEELYGFLKRKYNDVSAMVNENPILFLNKLTEIEYYAGPNDYFGFKVSRGNITGDYSTEDTRIEYYSSDRRHNRVIDAYRFTHQIEYSIDECKSRYGEQEDTTRKHKIIVIAPKTPGLIEYGRIYSFFATSELINAPFIIHAPFRLNSGRTKIDSQSQGIYSKNRWFTRTKDETIKMIHYAYERLAEIQGNLIRLYIPDKNLMNQGCTIYSPELDRSSILKWNLFETVDEKHVPAEDACLIDFNGNQEDLVSIHGLLNVEKSLLKINSNEVNKFRNLGILIIDDVNNKLLKVALLNKTKSKECMKYILDFRPDFSIKEWGIRELVLDFEQIQILSNYEKLSTWLNDQTFISLTSSYDARFVRDTYKGDIKSTQQICDFCNEYGDSINKEFVRYLNHVGYVEVGIKHVIFTYDHVYGKNMLEDFAEVYHRLDGKDKFFYPFLKIEAVSEEIDILCERGEEISDFDFLTLLQGHRRNQKNMLKNQYNSILKLIEKAGTDAERFFPEILQNIDDCIYKETPNAIIRTEKRGDNNKLIVEYNEIGFSRDQIRAITAIGDSTKKKLLSYDTTGEKGVGFKSVFGICSSVTIESGNFNFRLSSDKPTVPEYIKENELHKGTRMVFTLKPGFSKSVFEMLDDTNKVIKYCLCLKKVHSLYINQKELRITNKDQRRTLTFDGKKYEYYKYDFPVKVSNQLALYQRRKTKDVLQNQEITYLVPLPGNYDYKVEYCVYSTFPTQEKVNIPMIINMPLELDTARERIQDGEWNKEIIRQMLEGILSVYEGIKYIFKAKLPQFFPDKGVVLQNKYGHSSFLLQRIAKSPLFKVAKQQRYITLEQGAFSDDFEYEIIDRYEQKLVDRLPESLLEKDEDSYRRLGRLYGEYGRLNEREPADICKLIDYLFVQYSDEQDEGIIEDASFRKGLYSFLSGKLNDDNVVSAIVKKWKIIPIRYQKKTNYEAYSEDIYAPADEKNIDSAKYKLLDTKVMTEQTFNSIYAYMSGKYSAIKQFSRSVIINEFFEEIQMRLKSGDKCLVAKQILDLYEKEKKLFEETFKTRKDFPVDKMVFETKRGEFLTKDKCFNCDDENPQGCLDRVIVSHNFRELAKLIGVKSVEEIQDCKQLPFVIGRNELKDLRENRNLPKKIAIFNSLYLMDNKSEELSDGEGFFELYAVTARGIKLNSEQKEKRITVDDSCFRKYAGEINEISLCQVPISFQLNVKLDEFEKDSILGEIEDELQLRKETSKISSIISILNNCFYFKINRREPCCVREEKRRLLVIDSGVSTDYDIIEVLKAYFLKYFNTELSINRNIRLYTRRGFEYIETIESDDESVFAALPMAANVDLSNVEDIKDFLCRPLVLRGKTYGGYAKTCPLCNSRVDTELTGMRIYKTKCEGKIIPLISCSNCHENLRYSSEVKIDVDQIDRGVLNMHCLINGVEWTISNCTIRLAHRALIKEMNKSNIYGRVLK